MPNVLDVEPLRTFARRAARKISDEKAALRFEKFAFTQLLEDPRNFRTARPTEIDCGPGWARDAYARGEEVSVFRLNDAAARRIRDFARRLVDTCKVASAEPTRFPADASSIIAARRFLSKIGRASYGDALEKAKVFSRKLKAWEEDQDIVPLCDEGYVRATQGRAWSRIRSPVELRAIGRAFVNCLGRASTNSYYVSMMRVGLAQYWVLRDADGKGLIVAMLSAPIATEILEMKGPRNARVDASDADVVMLLMALGGLPSKPPPPPPPVSGGAALALASRQLCQCLACRRVRARRAPLREIAAAS